MPYLVTVPFGEWPSLGVAGEEVFEEGLRTGLAVVEQEVASVEEGIGAAHLPEVDEAGVPAMAVEPDVGHIKVAMS